MKVQMIWCNLAIFAIYGYMYQLFSHIYSIYHIFIIASQVALDYFASIDVKISIIGQTEPLL